MKHILVITDPQNDFCDQRGSLYVDGAAADIRRLAAHIERDGAQYTDIAVSLDSHDVIAVFHPKYWLDEAGAHPAPYTSITLDDYRCGTWRPASEENDAPTDHLFEVMVRKGVESLMVWPEHCVISTWGHQVADTLREALGTWRERTGRAVRFFFKGEYPYSEQFSIFEGIDDSFVETRFDMERFKSLYDADHVTFAGEALSHCVEASVASYMKHLDCDGGVRKKTRVSLLTDCTSPVVGFDAQASLDRIAAMGVALVASE